jgi:hypothetical protein
MFLSVITAPIVLALLIYFLIRRCHVNRIFILKIQSAMPVQDINTSAPILLAFSPYWLKFAALRLFVETIPIYKAVATGKGNNEFYRERTRSNLK